MKSVSLLSYVPGRNGQPDDLAEIARHFDTLWGTAVAPIDESSYLAADAEGNLIVLQHDKNGFSDEDRRRLRVTSEMLLGEMVNRIRPVTVTPTPNAIILPRAFCATVEGGVYLFALIAPGKQDLLIRLQERLAKVVTAPGDIPFAKFRGFKTAVRDSGEEGPMRFVDGQLVERFLDLEEGVQGTVVEGLPGVSAGVEGVEEVRGLVEGLRRVR
jgi:DNA damage-binding protein 1